VQNATVRRMVMSRRTNVLTTTLTESAADLRRHRPRAAIRQTATVLCLVGGALIGVLLPRRSGPAAPLTIAVAMFLSAAIAALPAASTRREHEARPDLGASS
jgi:uncharacterized membrane protein YoaK (UPF0700 family)